MSASADPKLPTVHRFLDEAGDTTFYGKGRTLIVGQEGVSLAFGIGMAKFNSPLPPIREAVREQVARVEADSLVNTIPSVARKIAAGGFFHHAKDDPPEVRADFFRFIKGLDCSFEMVVARKLPSMFHRKHNGHEVEFYADVLSHLIKNKLKTGSRQVLNIAERGKSTRNANLDLALHKGVGRFLKKAEPHEISSRVVFNVQTPKTEPLLTVADYFCWAVQRVFERGDTRFYDFLGDHIRVVIDLYDTEKYEGSSNYYRKGNPLTAQNKLSPPSH